MTRYLALALVIAGCAAAPTPAEAGPAPAAPEAAAPAAIAMAERPASPPASPAGAATKPKPIPSGWPADWPSPCPDDERPYVAGQVLVGMEKTATDAARKAFRAAFGVTAERPLLLPGVWVMRVPCETDVPALARKMAAWPGVKYAEPDQEIQLDDPIEGR